MDAIRKAMPIVGLILMAAGVATLGILHAPGMGLYDKKLIVAVAVAGAGLLLTLLGFQTRGFGPNFKYYLSYSLTSIFIFGSLVALYMILRNHSLEWDITEQKMHSLHPRTVAYLRTLDQDIRITAFPSPEHRRDIETILDRYSRAGTHLRYHIRNPYKDVTIAKRFADNVSPGDIFIEAVEEEAAPDQATTVSKRHKRLSAYSPRDLTESKLTNAIVEVVRPERVKIYYLTGHGEMSLEPSGMGMFGGGAEGKPSFSLLGDVLKDELSFTVETFRLIDKGFVPEDCSLLICAGPRVDLLPLEAQAIARYLEGGGRALLLLDPNEALQVQFDQFEKLMARFGVRIQHDIVLERNPVSQLTGDPFLLLVGNFGAHQTVSNLSEAVLQMSHVRTVAPLSDVPSTLTASELMYSSDLSWSEDIEALRAMTKIALPGPDRMKRQPLGVAVSVSGPADEEKSMRMAVLGDSDVFENKFLPNSVGLLVNLVNWLIAREDLIDIPAKTLDQTPIYPSTAQLRSVFTLLVLAFPSVILFGGLGYVLVRRRMR